jgi:hypothetical protein
VVVCVFDVVGQGELWMHGIPLVASDTAAPDHILGYKGAITTTNGPANTTATSTTTTTTTTTIITIITNITINDRSSLSSNAV